MKRWAPQTLAVIVVLALLALIAVVTSRSDEPAYDTYASTDFRGGGYRAWATLLAREGVVAARFVLRPIELDARIDTLLSVQPPPPATDVTARAAADIGALAAWVRRGGRLVYVGRNVALGDAENRLLKLPPVRPDVGVRSTLSGPWAADVRSLRRLGTDRMRLVNHAGRVALSDENGAIVVRYPFGRGEIIAAVDAVPFTNSNIAGADNARLAYLLGVPRRPGGVVAFDDSLHGALVDRPWYQALPVPVRVSLGIGGLALLLALVGSALPGIPPLRLQPEREPTSVEFLQALAALHERAGARAAARAILVRDALEAAAPSAGPGGDAGVRSLLRALDTPIVTDAELLASAKLAHKLRKDWTHGRSGDGSRAAFAGRARTRRRW